MSKFTFVCEDAGPVFVGSKIDKTTKEFYAGSIKDIVQEFEYFLRGCGYEFEGNISLKNITEPKENKSCSGGCSGCNTEDTISLGDVTIDIDNYGAAQPYYGYDEFSSLSFPAGVDTITLTSHDPSMTYPETNIDLEKEQPKKKKKK